MMNQGLIVLEPFQHDVRCCCPGQKHTHMIDFRKGDILTITNERKYVDCLGWHFLIHVNEEFEVFMSIHDIEELHAQGLICSTWDLELKENYLHFKINEALDIRDQQAFLTLSEELKSIQEMKGNALGTSQTV